MGWLVVIIAAAVLAWTATAASASDSAADGRRCTVSGFVAGHGPVQVRTGPGPAFPAVGTLPAPDPDAEMYRTAGFDVVEARGGWFRIENGAPWSASNEPSPGLAGWISGRDAAFSLQTHMGFAEPDPESAVRWRSRTMEEPDALAAIDCRGNWLQLLFNDQGAVREGWFRGVCDNRDTSCDRPPGDPYLD